MDTLHFTKEHPTIVAQLTQLTEDARRNLGYRNQPGVGQRPAGRIHRPKLLRLP